MLTLSLIFQDFFVMNVAYLYPITLAFIIHTAFFVAAFFIISAVAAAAYVYIVELNTKLDFVNVEHIKLLNAMHEGLLILDDQNRSEKEE